MKYHFKARKMSNCYEGTNEEQMWNQLLINRLLMSNCGSNSISVANDHLWISKIEKKNKKQKTE